MNNETTKGALYISVAAYIYFGGFRLIAQIARLVKNGQCEQARTVKEQHDADRAFNGSGQGIEADRHQIINLK